MIDNTGRWRAENRLRFFMRSPLRYLFAILLFAASTPAFAGTHDFSLLGLGKPASSASSDPVIQNYRKLAAEFATVIAPRAWTTAETLGVSGFEFAFALAYTGINASAPYWQGVSGVPVFDGVAQGGGVPRGFFTPTLQLRKGLPFSTDVGVQVAYIAQSSMVALGLDLKVAILESYMPKYLPDLAVRGALGRLVGSDSMTQTTLELDVLASYTFPISQQLSVSPTLGLGELFAHTSSLEMDSTPNITNDPTDAQNSIYKLPTLGFGANHMTRVFFGARLIYGVMTAGYYLDLVYIPGSIGAHTVSMTNTLKIGFDV